ncbi:MAG: winged helix-turn-helix transcriptional regulator [Candidatus Latescibacterota bacterium]|nr:MAG: winged helix-turn-helix transcriptional regulator [Candidatus Latescibacterota bacterium]
MKRDPEDIDRAARIFKALSHPQRLEIACRLAEGAPATQTQLVQELGWPQSTLARHLQPLRDLGLVVGERHGPEVVLTVKSAVVRTLVQSVCVWLHPENAGVDARGELS